MLFCHLWISFFPKNLTGKPLEYQTVWIQIRPEVLLATLLATSRERVNSDVKPYFKTLTMTLCFKVTHCRLSGNSVYHNYSNHSDVLTPYHTYPITLTIFDDLAIYLK